MRAKIGIDIGGTKMRAVWRDGKRVLKAKETSTPRNLAGFKKVLRKFGWGGAEKIGVGAAGVVSRQKLLWSPNIPYVKNFNFKTKLDNDARAFARAEYKNKKRTLFLTLGTGVGRSVGAGGKILKIKKFEYPERWEREYKKIRDMRNGDLLAKFLAKKLVKIIKSYKIRQIIVGGGVATRKNFMKKLERAFEIPTKKSKFGKNSVAIGATLLF